MKIRDDTPIDPEIAASLDAIDATLAGDPVDPKYAELAELALLLSADRPECSAEFAREMDARVARRFQAPPAHASGDSAAPPRKSRRAWLWTPAWAGGAIAAAVAVVVVLSSGGSTPNENSLKAPAFASSTASTASSTTASSASGAAANAPALRSATGAPARTSGHSATAKSTASAVAPQNLAPFGPLQSAPAPTPNGRKIIQGAELYLTARPSHIDAVAQEVFDVIGAENGFVNRSSVTAASGPGAYAEFQLSVPSQNLQTTMTQLSRLRFANVASRTDNLQDVNNQYNNDVRQLNDAKALRTKLLKQLALAVTTAQIDSLQAQIHDADAQISADQSTLNALNHSIDYSQIQVTINGYTGPAPVAHHSGGFTLGKAAHDAGRVLTVAAGVALIVLAALVPIALIIALGWWITTAIQRRRREHALDLA